MAKALREKHGLSLQQGADRIGCSKAHIFEFEKGTSINPSLGLIEAMATAYGISVESLFGKNDAPDMLLSPFALKIAIMIDRERIAKGRKV
jgi:transcriptional regulator with XRE-family HTH domain